MGGVLPVIPQRVLGIGGTAGMVHPSTGISFSHVHIKKSNNVHEPRNVFSSHPLTMAWKQFSLHGFFSFSSTKCRALINDVSYYAGYMVARTLAAAPILADSLVKRLGGSSSPYVSGSTSVSSAEASSTALQGAEGSLETNAYHQKGDELAAGVWEDLWPLDRQQQRAFFCFGMQVLLKVGSFILLNLQTISLC